MGMGISNAKENIILTISEILTNIKVIPKNCQDYVYRNPQSLAITASASVSQSASSFGEPDGILQ